MKKFIVEFFQALYSIMRGAFAGLLYKRLGKCVTCGRCCRHVYLRDHGELLANFDQYLAMVMENDKFKRFQVKGRDGSGPLYFGCSMISSDNKCTDYDNRPLMCKAYPDLGMIMYGAVPKEGCGFYFINRFTRRRVRS
jgi:Fe-S-cluster containining protein